MWAKAAGLADIAKGQLLERLELLGDSTSDLAFITDSDWEQVLSQMRLKLGQRRRVQAAIRALRATHNQAAPKGRRLQETSGAEPLANERGGRRAHLAIVTFVSEGRYFDRDRDPIALMNCFALHHRVPYYIESHDYGAHWYNKQHALRKYLPFYRWLLYLDSDTYVLDRVNGLRTILNLTATLDAQGYHIGVSELHHSGAGGFDAGAMLMKSSSVSWRLLDEWSAGSERDWRNA